MEIILGTIIALLVLFSLGLTGCAHGDDGTPAPTTQLVALPEPVAPPELRARLAELARSEPPKELSTGACCYNVAAPPERFDYVCPACNAKTVLADEPRFSQVPLELEACRRLVKEIRGLDVALVETGFCQTCFPYAQQRSLDLVVHHPDGSSHCVEGVTSDDLKLIAEFLAGKQVHDLGMKGEKPLRDYAERLAELLGTGPVDE